MRRNEEVINVRDAVLLKSGPRKKDLPFVARVAAIWEQDEGVCFYHRLKKIISGLCRMHAVTTHHRMKNSLFNPSKLPPMFNLQGSKHLNSSKLILNVLNYDLRMATLSRYQRPELQIMVSNC